MATVMWLTLKIMLFFNHILAKKTTFWCLALPSGMVMTTFADSWMVIHKIIRKVTGDHLSSGK